VPEGDGPGRRERGFGDTTGTVPFGEERQVVSWVLSSKDGISAYDHTRTSSRDFWARARFLPLLALRRLMEITIVPSYPAQSQSIASPGRGEQDRQSRTVSNKVTVVFVKLLRRKHRNISLRLSPFLLW
jgi:hypothetical protein